MTSLFKKPSMPQVAAPVAPPPPAPIIEPPAVPTVDEAARNQDTADRLRRRRGRRATQLVPDQPTPVGPVALGA